MSTLPHPTSTAPPATLIDAAAAASAAAANRRARASRSAAAATLPATRELVEFVIPVYNEQEDLPACVERLTGDLAARFPFEWRILIADNASTDDTLAVAHLLAQAHPGVHVLHLDRKGRGRALREAWLRSDADVVAYMDVDLSTDLDAVLPLVAPLLSGHSDVAIGSRLSRTSRVVRGAKREFISRCYNLIVRTALGARFRDAQCGFKAMRRDAADALLPLVEDGGWFFDTELLVLAERSGLRIHEVPVDWVDDPNSSVDVVATALEDLRGIRRVGMGLLRGRIPVERVRAELGRAPLEAERSHAHALPRHLVRFAAIGVASTLAYLLLFLLLRSGLGFGAQAANLTALLLTAVANTAANRRLTFGIRGRDGAARSQVEGLVLFGLGIALTSGSLVALEAIAPSASHGVEVVVLTIANLLVTLAKFIAFRTWVFHPRRSN